MKKRSVLYITDERYFSTRLISYLSIYFEIIFIFVENDQQAIQCLRENPDIDLCFTKILMPPREDEDCNGDELGKSTGLRWSERIKKEFPDFTIWSIDYRDDISFEEFQVAGIDRNFMQPLDLDDFKQSLKKILIEKAK